MLTDVILALGLGNAAMKFNYRPRLVDFAFAAVLVAFGWLFFGQSFSFQPLHGCKDVHAEGNRHFAYRPPAAGLLDYRAAGAAICAGEQACFVSFWNDTRSIPLTLPMSSTQLSNRKAIWLNRSCDLLYCNSGECGS